jgi:hypothetical protein
MTVQRFAEQPIGVKIGIALACFNSFVLLEELVIDRHGLAEFLPLYRIGNFCTYDVLALIAIIMTIFVLPGRSERRAGRIDVRTGGTHLS